jgi:maleylacetoacetate isomerase/maleylpyruvate isomerase
MKLYTYFRSSAAYRVRIALNLKCMDYKAVPVSLVKQGGQQRKADYLALNPAGLVPTLQTDDGLVITQSLAIIAYLDELQPEPALLPEAVADRAWVRSVASLIACDIHPINNLRVLQYLEQELSCTSQQKNRWYCHWVEQGLLAVERMLQAHGQRGAFCWGQVPTLADCCLVPQVFNARRFGCDLSQMPRVEAVTQACESLPAFKRAAPDNQPDAV